MAAEKQYKRNIQTERLRDVLHGHVISGQHHLTYVTLPDMMGYSIYSSIYFLITHTGIDFKVVIIEYFKTSAWMGWSANVSTDNECPWMDDVFSICQILNN